MTADILSMAAIPTGSENPLNAWRLLKILLSAEIQGGYDNSANSLKYLYGMLFRIFADGMRFRDTWCIRETGLWTRS